MFEVEKKMICQNCEHRKFDKFIKKWMCRAKDCVLVKNSAGWHMLHRRTVGYKPQKFCNGVDYKNPILGENELILINRCYKFDRKITE